ncbi:MAG: DUF5675 family protein [Bacteroidia bacterium]
MSNILSLEINRLSDDGKQTLGNLNVIGASFSCKTLELPYLDNKFQVSCIPCGTYIVKKRWSLKFGNHFHVTNVPNRSFVLIHFGNYYTDILGCILVGDAFKDINHDGLKDVTNSKVTLKKLYEIMPNEFKLVIK